MARSDSVRRDARENVARMRAAALDIFLAKGLDAPLDEIARAAGVSVGTLYYRFGSREGLIDAVLPDVAAGRLRALAATVTARGTPRQRLETFVRGMLALQRDDPGLNDAILRRYPDAVALLGVCDQPIALSRGLVRDAHADGSLSTDFTDDDLINLLWLAGTASRDPHAPAGWERVLERALDAAWTTPTNPVRDVRFGS